MEFRVLELFSGIGGMHTAFSYSKLPGEIAVAIDINTVANAVYAHNYRTTTVLSKNIQALSASSIKKWNVNTILMSPPCQPHTRVGAKMDIADKRSEALQHICDILPECPDIKYILIENVKGFECSEARSRFLDSLKNAGFFWREFILSPTQLCIPNTRHRYYCVARKKIDFPFEGNQLWNQLPFKLEEKTTASMETIRDILEPDDSIPPEMYLSDKILSKRFGLMDIVTSSASNTMCFTKAYTHYVEGTGSIYTSCGEEEMRDIFSQIEDEDMEEKRVVLLKRLRLRYFTPREVARLMCFPETFDFPKETTIKQKYRLLGNSINVRVVSELIKLFCT